MTSVQAEQESNKTMEEIIKKFCDHFVFCDDCPFGASSGCDIKEKVKKGVVRES